jgi:hypothetical protein
MPHALFTKFRCAVDLALETVNRLRELAKFLLSPFQSAGLIAMNIQRRRPGLRDEGAPDERVSTEVTTDDCSELYEDFAAISY